MDSVRAPEHYVGSTRQMTAPHLVLVAAMKSKPSSQAMRAKLVAVKKDGQSRLDARADLIAVKNDDSSEHDGQRPRLLATIGE